MKICAKKDICVYREREIQRKREREIKRDRERKEKVTSAHKSSPSKRSQINYLWFNVRVQNK